MTAFTLPLWASTPDCRAALARIASNPASISRHGGPDCGAYLRCYGPNVDPLNRAWNRLFDDWRDADEMMRLGADVRPNEVIHKVLAASGKALIVDDGVLVEMPASRDERRAAA